MAAPGAGPAPGPATADVRPGRRRRLPRLLLGGAWAALLLAWVFGNPPGAAPDEPYHVVKALGTVDGQGAGRPPPGPPAPVRAQQQQFAADWARVYRLPGRESGPVEAGCFAFYVEADASCATPFPTSADALYSAGYVGPAPPAPYVLPGLAAEQFGAGDPELLAARAVPASAALALLAAAAALSPGAARLAGLAVATTPMLLFLAATVGPSGLEVAAAVCTVAAALALARGRVADDAPRGTRWERPGNGAFAAAAVGGSVLVLARTLGPVWLVGAAVLVLLVARPGGRVGLLRDPRTWLTALPLAAAGAFQCWWLLTRTPPGSVGPAEARGFLRPAVQRLPEAASQLVGRFGWLDTALPPPLVLGWGVLLAGLVVAALALGPPRHAAPLLVAAAAVPGLFVVLDAATQWPFGFAVQGRYVLPLAVALPLVAAEALATATRGRRWGRLGALAAAAVVVATAGVHAVAWWVNARRYATGTDGPWLFWRADDYAPLAGWAPWASAAALGVALLVLAGLAALRPDRPTRPTPLATGSPSQGAAGDDAVSRPRPDPARSA